jgi:hypothetical protein
MNIKGGVEATQKDKSDNFQHHINYQEQHRTIILREAWICLKILASSMLTSFSWSHDHPYSKSLSQTTTVGVHGQHKDPICWVGWLQSAWSRFFYTWSASIALMHTSILLRAYTSCSWTREPSAWFAICQAKGFSRCDQFLVSWPRGIEHKLT